MSFRTKLVGFFDELMILFDGDALIYPRLLTLRHYIRISSIDEICNEFINLNRDKFKRHDVNCLEKTAYAFDFKLIWSRLGHENKMRVWKWIDSIIDD